MNSGPKATVIILTKNGLPRIEACLAMVFRQETPWPFEVLAIDSGSTDGTLEVIHTSRASLFEIPPETFNHGATRNLGAEKASGEFLVFLVQDAIPTNTCWLVNLVSAADSPRVAGSYSKQLVRSESSVITHYMSVGTTPCSDTRNVQALPSQQRLLDLTPEEQFGLALFQNASSCIRKRVWIEYPFAPLSYGEDIEWGKRVIEAGYSIVYEPSSAAYHSHDRSVIYTLKRAYADHFQAAELFDLILIPSLFRALRVMAWASRTAWTYIAHSQNAAREKLWSGLIAPVFLVSQVIGQYLGSHVYRWLPRHKWLRHLDGLLRSGV